MTSRLFLLSPANCGGPRASHLLAPAASTALAAALRSSEGAPLGEIFAYISALYFRGKLTYSRRFARPPAPADPIVGAGVHIITTNAGLRPPDSRVRADELQSFGDVDIRAGNRRFTGPLQESARRLLDRIPPGTEIVLLGSVASEKYVSALLEVFGRQLCFPAEFVGRGDMSRGGLLLRSAATGT